MLTLSKFGISLYDRSLKKELRHDTKVYRSYYPPVAKILLRIRKEIYRQYMQERRIYTQIKRKQFLKYFNATNNYKYFPNSYK